MIRARALIRWGAVGACLLGAGCEKIIGANFDVKEVTCSHVGPPPPSSVKNAGGDIEFLVYVAAIDTGDTTGAPDYNHTGFDLDGLCTYESQGPSCKPFAWAGADPTDGVNGIDNKMGALMNSENIAFGARAFSSDILNSGLSKGQYLPIVIFRVRGYDGASEDDQVEVDWYVPGPSGGRDKGIAADGGAAGPWSLSAGTLGDGGEQGPDAGAPPSIFRDTNAYVTSYQIVAHFPAGTVLTMANTPFALEGAAVILHIQPSPLSLVTGTLVGRIREQELFAKLPFITTEVLQIPVCENFATYGQIKSYFCSFADILADGTVDPSRDCDAISMGMSLTLGPATLGAAVDAVVTTPCQPAVDPVNDSCEKPVVASP